MEEKNKPAAQPQGEPVAYRYKRGNEPWENENPWEPTTLTHGAVLLERKSLAANGTFKGDERDHYLALAVEPLFARKPAPVAAVLSGDWQDQLFAEMERRFKLRKHIDDDHMVIDDTQLGVEFACEWMAGRLNASCPAHANPPPGTEPSGTHPHNDGLDEMRKPAMCDCNQGRLPCRCKP